MILINFDFAQTAAEKPKLKLFQEQVREALTRGGVSNLSVAVTRNGSKLSLATAGPQDEIARAEKIVAKFSDA